jgi:hypothetical protein
MKVRIKRIAQLLEFDDQFRQDLLRELRKALIHDQTGFFDTAQLNTEPALRYHTSEAGSGFVERAQGIIKAAEQLGESTDELAASIALKHFNEATQSKDPHAVGPRRRFKKLINEL